jgi:hypothetical protein
MAVVRGAFDELITPGARKVFVDEYDELPAVYTQWINVDTTGRAFEDELVMTGLGIAVSKPEGEPIAFDRPRMRGRVRYLNAGFGLGYEVTKEAVEDDLYDAIVSQGSTNLSRSMREAEEVSAHSLLNNAFSSVMAYDGVPLISTAHPGLGGLTFANRPAVDEDLSVAALKSSSERFMLMQTDRGLRIVAAPSILLVPVQSYYTALEILGAEYNPAGAMGQYTPNVVPSKMGLAPMVSPYITDPDSWFVMGAKGKHSLKRYWRRSPEDESGYDGRRQISWYGVTARWGDGVRDWRWIDGSPGA